MFMHVTAKLLYVINYFKHNVHDENGFSSVYVRIGKVKLSSLENDIKQARGGFEAHLRGKGE